MTTPQLAGLVATVEEKALGSRVPRVGVLYLGGDVVQLRYATLSVLFASEQPTSLEEVVDLEAAVTVPAAVVPTVMVTSAQ